MRWCARLAECRQGSRQCGGALALPSTGKTRRVGGAVVDLWLQRAIGRSGAALTLPSAGKGVGGAVVALTLPSAGKGVGGAVVALTLPSAGKGVGGAVVLRSPCRVPAGE